MELGRLLSKTKNYAEALTRFNRALDIKPDFAAVQEFRAEAFLALGSPVKAAEALDIFLAAKKIPSAKAYYARALMYADTKHLPAAIEMFTLALQQDPNDTEIRCTRGWTYLLTGAVSVALEDFETCLRDDKTAEDPANVPGSPRNRLDALIGRGNARIRLNQLSEAIADAKAAQTLAAEEKARLTARLLYNLARIYAQAGGQQEVKRGRPNYGPIQPPGDRRKSLSNKRLTACSRRSRDFPRNGRTCPKIDRSCPKNDGRHFGAIKSRLTRLLPLSAAKDITSNLACATPARVRKAILGVWPLKMIGMPWRRLLPLCRRVAAPRPGRYYRPSLQWLESRLAPAAHDTFATAIPVLFASQQMVHTSGTRTDAN